MDSDNIVAVKPPRTSLLIKSVERLNPVFTECRRITSTIDIAMSVAADTTFEAMPHD
jgi:hypothetical protein